MEDVARILDKMMVGQGLNDYLAQGGDVGGFLARMIAVKYSSCKGLPSLVCRVTFLADLESAKLAIVSTTVIECKCSENGLTRPLLNLDDVPPPAGVNPMTDPNLNGQHRQDFVRAAWFRNVGSAYSQEHATRPATIGLVLSSSPIALLAWCVKFTFMKIEY